MQDIRKVRLEQNIKNITRQTGNITRKTREALLGQTACTIWFTGLSGAGKTTLAFALESALVETGRACFVLDGDNLRHGLNSNIGFSAEDRSENIRRVAEVARLMNDAGLIVIAAFISPFKADREIARQIIGTDCFREVYVSTPLDVCESRDSKGLYSKVRSGVITEFTGISSPYDVPDNPTLEINTSKVTIQDALLSLSNLVL